MGAGGVRGGEAAGGLQDEVDAELGPRQGLGVALGEHLDPVAGDDQLVPLDGDRVAEAAERAVEAEQVGERVDGGEVVDRDHLQLAAALHQGAQAVAADAAEPVDGDAGHGGLPLRFRAVPGCSGVVVPGRSVVC